MTEHCRDQTIVLADGRRLGYAEHGVQAGRPVFVFHGAASSRLERPVDETVLPDLEIRLIGVDRPGHGLSDLKPGRRLLDWPDDVAQLADQLGLDQFYVMGYSSGGPHALACAYALPKRVIAGAAVSSVAPMGRPGAFKGLPLPNRLLAGSARRAPWLVMLIRRVMRSMLIKDVETAARQLMASLPEADKKALYAPESIELLAQSVREGFRSGWRGVAWDDVLINRDWGFGPAEIRVPIELWHGDLDVNVPPHAGEYLHREIPNSTLIMMPGQGHFVLLTHWRPVLAALVAMHPES